MARLIGNEGSATIASLDYGITANAWSMTISRVVSDVTAYGDTATNVRGGIPTYTGSVSGFMDDTEDPLLDAGSLETGDTCTLTLVAQSGNQWSGTAILSGASVSSSKTGDATISLDFAFVGAPDQIWS